MLSIRISDRQPLLAPEGPRLGLPQFRVIPDEGRPGTARDVMVLPLAEWNRFVAANGGTAGGTTVEALRTQLARLGFPGRGTLKVFQGKPHVILGGPAGARRYLLRGGYKPTRPTVLDLALTLVPLGGRNLAASSLSVAFVDCETICGDLLADRRALTEIEANIAADLPPEGARELARFVAETPYGSRSGTTCIAVPGPTLLGVSVGFNWDRNLAVDPLAEAMEQTITETFAQANFHLSALQRQILFRLWPHDQGTCPT